MKISVITINLNNSGGLSKTFKSVFSQKYKNYEYIVIDGGSNDESLKIIKKHKNKISYWKSEKDSGVYEAMNKGILKASGEYLIFLNSGDYFIDNSVLEKVEKYLVETDIIYFNAFRIGSNSKIEEYSMPKKLTLLYFYRYSICHQSIFYRRQIFNLYGMYNEKFKIVSDWEFNLKMFLNNDVTWKHIDIPISYFDNTGLSSKNIELLEKEKKISLSNILNNKTLKKLKYKSQFRDSILGKIFIKLKVINRW